MSRKWVSVYDYLPKKSGLYIVYVQEPLSYREIFNDPDMIYFDTSGVDSAYYDKDAGLWKVTDSVVYCANTNCINSQNVYFISHWMSMPKAPKDKIEAPIFIKGENK